MEQIIRERLPALTAEKWKNTLYVHKEQGGAEHAYSALTLWDYAVLVHGTEVQDRLYATEVPGPTSDQPDLAWNWAWNTIEMTGFGLPFENEFRKESICARYYRSWKCLVPSSFPTYDCFRVFPTVWLAEKALGGFPSQTCKAYVAVLVFYDERERTPSSGHNPFEQLSLEESVQKNTFVYVARAPVVDPDVPETSLRRDMGRWGFPMAQVQKAHKTYAKAAEEVLKHATGLTLEDSTRLQYVTQHKASPLQPGLLKMGVEDFSIVDYTIVLHPEEVNQVREHVGNSGAMPWLPIPGEPRNDAPAEPDLWYERAAFMSLQHLSLFPLCLFWGTTNQYCTRIAMAFGKLESQAARRRERRRKLEAVDQQTVL